VQCIRKRGGGEEDRLQIAILEAQVIHNTIALEPGTYHEAGGHKRGSTTPLHYTSIQVGLVVRLKLVHVIRPTMVVDHLGFCREGLAGIVGEAHGGNTHRGSAGHKQVTV
jgi:hypothetical protein